jgi:hypothetical protein
VDWIIPCKSSSFSIRNVASRGTLPTTQALRPNTFNNGSEVKKKKKAFFFATLQCNKERERRRRPSSFLHCS